MSSIQRNNVYMRPKTGPPAWPGTGPMPQITIGNTQWCGIFKGFDLNKVKHVEKLGEVLKTPSLISKLNFNVTQMQTLSTIFDRMAQNKDFKEIVENFMEAGDRYNYGFLGLRELKQLRKYGHIFFDGPGETIESLKTYHYAIDLINYEDNPEFVVEEWWWRLTEDGWAALLAKTKQIRYAKVVANLAKKTNEDVAEKAHETPVAHQQKQEKGKKTAAPRQKKGKGKKAAATRPPKRYPKKKRGFHPPALSDEEAADDFAKWKNLSKEDALSVLRATPPVIIDSSSVVNVDSSPKPTVSSNTPISSPVSSGTITATVASKRNRAPPVVSEYNLRKRKIDQVAPDEASSSSQKDSQPQLPLAKVRKTTKETQSQSPPPNAPKNTKKTQSQSPPAKALKTTKKIQNGPVQRRPAPSSSPALPAQPSSSGRRSARIAQASLPTGNTAFTNLPISSFRTLEASLESLGDAMPSTGELDTLRNSLTDLTQTVNERESVLSRGLRLMEESSTGLIAAESNSAHLVLPPPSYSDLSDSDETIDDEDTIALNRIIHNLRQLR